MACNEDGVWNEAGASLAVMVLPPFWQTWWFLTLAVLAMIGAIVTVVHYLSTQKLQRQLAALRQQEALEKERARIARDLHDQLGANLTQVALLGEMVESDKDLPRRKSRPTPGRFPRPRARRPARWMKSSGRSIRPTTRWTG